LELGRCEERLAFALGQQLGDRFGAGLVIEAQQGIVGVLHLLGLGD